MGIRTQMSAVVPAGYSAEAMAISQAGCPKLFPVSTYTPKWPELCTVANNGTQWPTLMYGITQISTILVNSRMPSVGGLYTQ
jgi:hypothetical protein